MSLLTVCDCPLESVISRKPGGGRHSGAGPQQIPDGGRVLPGACTASHISAWVGVSAPTAAILVWPTELPGAAEGLADGKPSLERAGIACTAPHGRMSLGSSIQIMHACERIWLRIGAVPSLSSLSHDKAFAIRQALATRELRYARQSALTCSFEGGRARH